MIELTAAQKHFFNLDRYVGSSASTLCGAVFFDKINDVNQLQRILNKLVEKNDALRIRITSGSPKQFVSEYAATDFEFLQFDSIEEFEKYAKSYAKKPMDLYGQLFYPIIVQVKERIGILIKAHHIIIDASSAIILARQIIKAADGIEPEAFSFIDYAEKQIEKDTACNSEYFCNILKQKPTSHWQTEIKGTTFDSEKKRFSLSDDFTQRIRYLSKKLDVPLWAVLLAAIGSYLGERTVIGFPQYNRVGKKQKETVGLFINTLPIILDYTDDFSQSCISAYDGVLSALRHADYDYEVLNRSLGGNSIYDVLFDYKQITNSMDGIHAFWYSSGRQYEAIQFHFEDIISENRVDLIIDYHTDLFSPEQIDEIYKAIEAVICCNIEKKSTANYTKKTEYPNASIYELFENNTIGGKIICGEHIYCADDLRSDAEKIDAIIRSNKRVIGVICERSYTELAAIYGIIRGGNAYLPISSDYPAERINLMLSQCDCDTVLAQRKYASLVDDALIIEDIIEKNDPPSVPPIAATADDTLYVIFTSGSTGVPKGVMISNRSAANRINWMCNRYFRNDSVVMLKTPYTFDVSVWEIFGFALGGFSLYILPPDDHYQQKRVIEQIRKGCVTDIHFVPSVFRAFLEALQTDGGKLPSLKNIFLSGEPLLSSLVNSAPVNVHNLYGPTECAVDVTYYDCAEHESDPIPIGKPIDNCRVYILNSDLHKLPTGVKGQICIGGVSVGKGYIGDVEKTAVSFVPNPFEEGLIYLTGDYGYLKADGNIVFLGRIDNQIKINGQRIELGEIETVLNQIVSPAVVVFDNNKIIAYYSGFVRSDLREKMLEILPRHMIPHVFIHVDEIPITSHGKLDRIALLGNNQRKAVDIIAPATPEEEILVKTVAEVLSLPVVSISDSFYEIGGDSLSSVRIITSLQDCGFDISVADFINSGTMKDAAKKMKRLMPNAYLETGGLQTTAAVDSALEIIVPLYTPIESNSAIVLFPYGGGDAAAYTALAFEFRKRNSNVSLFFCPWTDDYDSAEKEINALLTKYSLRFYSHCAGAVVALKLLDRLNSEQLVVKDYYIGANVPPTNMRNIWRSIPDPVLLSTLHKAGMPKLTDKQALKMLQNFRKNTEEYFDYFRTKTKRTVTEGTLIISKNDIFTKNYRHAEKIWTRYITEVKDTFFVDSNTHYFQSSFASGFADILLNR